MATGDRTGVLLAAGGAGWESRALEVLAEPGVAVLKRCVDVTDLLVSATTGQADVAVVSSDLSGLDADAVVQLLRHDVRTVSVGPPDLGRLGVVRSLAVGEVPFLAEAVRTAGETSTVDDPEPEVDGSPSTPSSLPASGTGDEPRGRILAVWGPAGAPGRTTVAVTLAARLAERDRPVVLADLDPYGGAVAQHLGILDEASGLLAAARSVNSGELDDARFAAARRRVGDRLEVLTGLPRPDRWIEVRDGVAGDLLQRASEHAHVVADTGFSLEDDSADFGRGLGRNRMTLDALDVADEVVVVGHADAVGLSRLARGLVELRERAPATPARIVVNRMRGSLGWTESDIEGMVEGFVRPAGFHVLPDDRAACDRAMLVGAPLAADTPLGRALADLAAAVLPPDVPTPTSRRLRPRLRRRGR